MTPEAERFNGWAAMLGFVAAVGAYVTTGQIIPGHFLMIESDYQTWLMTMLFPFMPVIMVFVNFILLGDIPTDDDDDDDQGGGLLIPAFAPAPSA